jgi:hypothetical protein
MYNRIKKEVVGMIESIKKELQNKYGLTKKETDMLFKRALETKYLQQAINAAFEQEVNFYSQEKAGY